MILSVPTHRLYRSKIPTDSKRYVDGDKQSPPIHVTLLIHGEFRCVPSILPEISRRGKLRPSQRVGYRNSDFGFNHPLALPASLASRL